MASNEYKKKFFDLNKIYFNVSEATNIKTNKKELIPINAICSFCHTNGLASGNTFEEAVNQAIFEIFERYCYQKCLEENILIRNIDISSYPLTEKNKKMLVLLKKKGFEYYIKDCIFSTGKYKSKSEVRRLIQQGAVKLNGERFEDLAFKPIDGTIIQVGKGNMFRLAQNQEVKKTLIKK